MTAIEDSRLALGVRLERLGLVLRYVAYCVLAPVFLLGFVEGRYQDLAIITGVVAAHNLFVHGILWTRRYDLFRSPLNFFAHLVDISLVVRFTGAEESEFYVLYFFLLIGYTVYRRQFWRIALVTVVTCASYGVVILVEWHLSGLREPAAILFVRMMGILVCGWLVAVMSELLRNTEDAAASRAQALASSEAALRMILDSAAEPILVYDEQERVTEANDRACEFLNMDRRQIVGQRFRTFLFDDGSVADDLAEAQSGNEYHGEQIMISASGRERAVELHVRSYLSGQRRYCVALAHDITERKNLQEATHLANANLARLNRELQQVNEMKTGLLMTISQRLRSPLTAILGYIDMVLNDELGPISDEQRKALQSCRRSTIRVFRFIDEALDLPSAEAPRPGPP